MTAPHPASERLREAREDAPLLSGRMARQGGAGGSAAGSKACRPIWEAGEAREDIYRARVERRGVGSACPGSIHTLGQLPSLASLSSLNDQEGIEKTRKEAEGTGDFILPDCIPHPPYPPYVETNEHKMGQNHG